MTSLRQLCFDGPTHHHLHKTQRGWKPWTSILIYTLFRAPCYKFPPFRSHFTEVFLATWKFGQFQFGGSSPQTPPSVLTTELIVTWYTLLHCRPDKDTTATPPVMKEVSVNSFCLEKKNSGSTAILLIGRIPMGVMLPSWGLGADSRMGTQKFH
jgi:hypothetical protein